MADHLWTMYYEAGRIDPFSALQPASSCNTSLTIQSLFLRHSLIITSLSCHNVVMPFHYSIAKNRHHSNVEAHNLGVIDPLQVRLRASQCSIS